MHRSCPTQVAELNAGLCIRSSTCGGAPSLRYPTKQVMLVPGIFACSNLSFYPLAEQSVQVVNKLDGFFDWVSQHAHEQQLNLTHSFVCVCVCVCVCVFVCVFLCVSCVRVGLLARRPFAANVHAFFFLPSWFTSPTNFLLPTRQNPSRASQALRRGTSTIGPRPSMVRLATWSLVPWPCPMW